MGTGSSNFEHFMKQREEAARAYVGGDAAPLGRIVARASMATFFGPMGGHVQGSHDVAARYEHDAALFAPEGQTDFEVFHAAAGGDVAYWTGIQHAVVRMQDGMEAKPMDLRVTEVFRRERDGWKLIHRHADTLVRSADEKPTG